MPIFELDGKKYDVEDKHLDSFATKYPEAYTVGEKDGKKWKVRAKNYTRFLGSSNEPEEPKQDDTLGSESAEINASTQQSQMPKITKDNIGSMGFVQDEASALYPMSSTRLQSITSLDGKLRGTEQAEKEFNQAMEEKEIDKYFVPKQMNTADDVFENFATRFTNTQEGVTLNEGIAKKTKEIQDKYLKDYMSSKEFAELSKQYKGEEFQKKANEQFQFMYGDKIENELKPINENYSKAINTRYGKQINDELSRIAKNDASTELTRISKSTDEALDSVEEQIKKRRRQLRNDNWKPGHPMDVARNDNMLSELNVERSYLSTAQNLNDDSMKVLEAAKKEKDGTFIGGLGRGVADSVFDIDTWTMGITGMVDEMRLNNVLTKSEKGEKLTDAEKNLLDACVNNMAINHYYGSDLGYGYQAGKITGESLPFMLEYLINPVSASGKTLAKRILTWGLKNNIKGMSTKGAKMAARFLGDAIAAGGVTLSSGAGMVGEGTVERLNRNFKFSNDDNGNLVVTNTGEISTGEAFGKSLTSAFLERQSEMIFNAFRPLKGKPVNTLAERMQWHGLAEEQLEEVYNNFMNIPLGEMTLEEATSLEQNLITFLGLAPTQVAFSAWGGVGYAVERYNAKKKIREAYGALTPEQQDKLKELEELAKDHRNRDIAIFLSETLKDKSLTQEQKRAELEYAYNLVVNNAIEEAEEAETQSRVEADNVSIDAATDTQTGNYAQVTAIFSDGAGGTKEVVGNVVGWIGDSPIFVADGMENTEENRRVLKQGEWNPETLIERPAEEVKAINEEMIREEVAHQAEMESEFAPEVLNAQMQQGVPFETLSSQIIPISPLPEGNGWVVEEYPIDVQNKTAKQPIIRELTNDEYRAMLQVKLDVDAEMQRQMNAEAVQAESASSESVGEQVNTPVNTEVNNPMENAESTPMSEEVQSATEEKSTQPVIPTKKDGSIDFVAYGREGTFKTLGEKYGEKLPNKVAVTAKALAEDVVKAEEKLAKAEEAYDNAPIGREQKAEQARDKARQELEEIKKEADYWKAIDEEIKEAQKVREAIVNPTVEADMTDEPMTTEEFVAKALADGGIRLTSDSYKKELGYGEKERKRFPKMFAKKENGGLSIEEAGEWLMQWDSENGTNFFDQEDANAGRDALINFLGSVRTWGDITGYIRRNREQLAERESEGLRNEVENAIESNYHMTPEEYATLQEVESVENPFGGLDVATKDAIFVEAYEEYEQSLNPKQNDEGRTSEIAEGNGAVLSEERTDNEGGTSERQGERPDLSEGAVQQNDAAQEAEQVEEPLTIQEGESPVAFAERVLEEQRRKPLRNRANEWAKALGVKVHFIERLEDVENQAAYLALSNGSKVAGWYEGATGEVFLYMPNLDNVSEVDKTYIHEVVAHKGLREMLGKERFNELCDKVWDMMPDKEKAEFIQYEGVNGDTRAAADEYIAYLAEKEDLSPEEQTIWDSIVKMFRDMLDRALNGIIGKSKLTDKDISDLIKASYANLKSGAEGTVGEGTRFSVKPIGVGAFGNIYNQFKGKAKEAIRFLMQIKEGEAIGALYHPEIGDIDLVWGKEGTAKSDGYGLSKLVTYHPEVLDNLQEILNDMHVTKRSDNRVKLESETHQAAVRLTWDNVKKNWLLTAFEKGNSAFDNTTDTDETSERGKRNDTATPQNTVSDNKYKVSDSEKQEKIPLFRVVNDKNGKKTLVGLHNISEEKLRKAIKQGGLANPSMAVIDMDKQSHVDYGDITLVAPADLIDKKTGKNAGTFTADAYTPIYPSVTKTMSKKGDNKYWDDLQKLEKSLISRVKLYFDNYLDSDVKYDALYYWFLEDTGKNPSIKKNTPEDYSEEELNKIVSINPDANGFYNLNNEEKQKVVDLFIEKQGGREAFEKNLADRKAIMEANLQKPELKGIFKKKIEQKLKELDEYGYDYNQISDFYSKALNEYKSLGMVDEHSTFYEAKKAVENGNMTSEFEQWLAKKEADYGVEEQLWVGTDKNGRNKYIPNTLENASKLMKKQGLEGAQSLMGFNHFVAHIAPKLGTLKDISKRKKNLTTQAEYDEFTSKWMPIYQELGSDLQPDADRFHDYGFYRLEEIVKEKNPKEYVKKEYGIDLSDDFLNKLEGIKDAIKNDFPARYFETKFERPVYLNEFSAAVVPQGTSKDVVDALTEAGLQIEEYESGNNEARMAAVDKVSSEIEGIRFRVKSFETANEELDKEGISINNKELMDEYGLSDITLSKSGNHVTLSKVVVEDKGKGNGTRFMEDLTNNADNNGWILALTPDTSFGGSSVARLKKFYKRFGFKDNKGRNTDFETRESMVRPVGGTRFRISNQNQEIFAHEPAIDYVSQANDVVEVPRDEVMYTMNNIASQLYKTSGRFMRQLYQNGTLGRVLKGDYAEIDQIKAKNEYDHAKPILDEYLNELVWMKYQATDAAQEVINGVISDVEYAIKYYKDLSLGKDVWRTEERPRFRIVEKQREDVNKGVDSFTSKYNSKPVSVASSEMTDEELEKAVPTLLAEDTRKAIEEGVKGKYSVKADKIYIFADNVTKEELEDTLFHENLHPMFSGNPIIEEFYANFNAKHPEQVKMLAEGYEESEVPEEVFVTNLAVGMQRGNFKMVEPFLAESSREDLYNTLKAFGYDYEQERGRRNPERNSGKGSDVAEDKKVVDRSRGKENSEGQRESSREQAEKLRDLFGRVADMGLDGVLGNEAYDRAMMDIYSVLPEDSRKEVIDDAFNHYGMNIAPAVSDYIHGKSDGNILDKIVAIIRNALRKAGFNIYLNGNEVKYLAWRSKKPLDRNSLVDMAEDIYKKYQLKVGEYSTNDDGTTPDGGGTRFRRVYHGSSASFDKFDHSFMGTGEGAQAFGWGTYVTEVKGIGKDYARKLATDSNSVNYIGEFANYVGDDVIRIAKSYLIDSKYNLDRAKEHVRRDLKLYAPPLTRKGGEFLLSTSEEDWFIPKGNRHLYEVEIPDNDGSNYIEWDEVISEEELDGILNKLADVKDTNFDIDYFSDKVGEFTNEYNLTGRWLYELLSKYGFDNKPKNASKALEEIGYIGIEYPANALTGGRSDGAKNYVIFNEKDLQIVEHTRFRVTPKMDAEYLEAVNSGDMEKAQKMVLEAAKMAMPNTKVVDENGYPKVVYHGTTNGNFTVFDPSVGIEMSKSAKHYKDRNFFTSDKDIADGYSMYMRTSKNDPYPSIPLNIDTEQYVIEKRDTPRHYDRLLKKWIPAETGYFVKVKGEFIPNTYAKTPEEAKERFEKRLKGIGYTDTSTVFEVFLNIENPKYVDAEGRLWRNVDFGDVSDEDGIVVENVKDASIPERVGSNGGIATDYIVFNPSQIKSAEAVTYDDNGNVIPLSERFNPEQKDIRFKVKETKKERIADLRAEIADLKREVTNARKNSQEEWETNQRAIISFIKGKLTKEAGEEFGKYRIDQLLNLVNKATTAKDLRKPFQFIEQVINSAIMDREAARMEKLIKTKLQGETSRGVAKGVVVDESTRRLFDSIRGTFKDLISTSIDSELRHVRSEILRFGKEINDLPADDIQGRTILTARQEALKERRKELEAEQEELRKNNVVETKESLKKRYDELVDAMDAHIDGKGAWTIEMQDEYDSIPLREKLAEIREAQAQLDDILTDALNTRRAAYGLKGGERKKMLAEADILDSNYSIAQEELIRLMSEVSRDLEEIIKEGKSRLASRREALDERRRKIVSMGIGAVKDRKVIAPNAALTKEEKWHKWFDNSGLKKFTDFMTAPLNSFNFLLKYIDRNHTIGEGELYNYFMKSQEGALEANNRLYDGLKAYNTAIEEKAKEIFGKSIEKVMKDSGKEYNDRVTKQYMFDSTSHREGERYPIRISKGQALYVWLTWRQEDGRAKLLADGWTEESIAEIEDLIGGDYMKFGEWITDEFFPQLREEKYNKTHIEMFGTSMAKRERYFPFKVNAEDIQEKGEMGESYEGMPSTITGNIIKRTINKSRINTEQNAFDLLYKYGNDMETWNAMAKLRQDLNFLHASKAFRNYMEANSKGLFNTFMKAAEVAVKAYNNSAEANPINDFFVKLNRMWAGSNIGFRLNTAMKQILSYPAFMAYSGNPKFQINLGKYMLNWKGNYDWAKENLPAFRQRIETGDMGMTGMTDPQFDFAKYFKKFTDAGMIPNQLVDALTCAAGARSVYDFEYNQAIKNGLSEEEAKNVAQYNAEVAFNETQQSSREEFVSPIQMSRNVLIKSMMNYQNSNVGYQRMGNEGLLEIMRAKRVYEQDLKNGMNEAEAKKKMANSIARGARKAMVAFTILPGLWYLGGRGIVGITAPLISSLFGGGGDDEPYLDDEAKVGLLVSIGLGTVAGTAGGQLIGGLVQGREYNPMAWMNEMQKDIVGAVNNGWNMNTTKNIALRLAKFGGVNMETWENIYLGAEHAIRTGNFDLVDFMMLINLPASQRKAMAEELYSDMPFMEYADKVSRAQKLFDDYRKYLPYAKTDKNGSKSNAIKKQYIIENLSEEKQDKLEKEKEFKKLQREYGQAEDKAEWLEEHPEYDEMEKDFKSQKVTKEVNREAKKLK